MEGLGSWTLGLWEERAGGLELLGPEGEGHWDPRLLGLDGGWGAGADS